MTIPPGRIDRLAQPESLGFSQSVCLPQPARTVYVGGQVPSAADGSVPESFTEQARLAWDKVLAELEAAGMTREALVKATIFLADRADAAANREARLAALGPARPVMTVVLANLLDPRWKIEIEAVACA